jgi:hypothetical protein
MLHCAVPSARRANRFRKIVLGCDSNCVDNSTQWNISVLGS